MRLRNLIERCCAIALIAVFVGAWPATAEAKPEKRKDVIGPAGFKKGSTVTVYIEVDPQSKLKIDDPGFRDRVPDAIGGIGGWKQPLK